MGGEDSIRQAKSLLDEIEAYIDGCDDVAERLALIVTLEAIVGRIRELNMRCVP